MSSKIEEATIKMRRDTAANWASVNPIPLEGEFCLETDTVNIKAGDGIQNYNDLPTIKDGEQGPTGPQGDTGQQGDQGEPGDIESPIASPLIVLNTTESTDKDTGALIVEGGVGIEKNLNVGGTITGNLDLSGAWPIGSTYIQFPGDSDPSTLSLPGTWSNVSSELAGDFIRFEGGNASVFNAGQQNDAFQGHADSYFSGGHGDTVNNTDVNMPSIPQVGTSAYVGGVNTGNRKRYTNTRGAPVFYSSFGTPRIGSETRPKNRTARKWRRVS